MTTCKLCGVETHPGNTYSRMTSRCRDCHKAAMRANRAAKVEYYRAYDTKRFQEDPRVRERHSRYRKTEAGKAALKRGHDRWVSDNPEKRAAHNALNNAVRDGIVEKPDACQCCGAIGLRIEAHHDDYSRPLVVRWMCRACHLSEHRRADGFEPVANVAARLLAGFAERERPSAPADSAPPACEVGAAIGRDDSPWRVTYAMGEPVPKGAVVVEVEA